MTTFERALLLGLGLFALSVADARAMSCREERGDEASPLVEACKEVSPATHPPCNAANSCDLIESEVKRGCAMLERRDRPAFCKDVGE